MEKGGYYSVDWNTGLDYWTDIFWFLHMLWLVLMILTGKTLGKFYSLPQYAILQFVEQAPHSAVIFGSLWTLVQTPHFLRYKTWLTYIFGPYQPSHNDNIRCRLLMLQIRFIVSTITR